MKHKHDIVKHTEYVIEDRTICHNVSESRETTRRKGSIRDQVLGSKGKRGFKVWEEGPWSVRGLVREDVDYRFNSKDFVTRKV